MTTAHNACVTQQEMKILVSIIRQEYLNVRSWYMAWYVPRLSRGGTQIGKAPMRGWVWDYTHCSSSVNAIDPAGFSKHVPSISRDIFPISQLRTSTKYSFRKSWRRPLTQRKTLAEHGCLAAVAVPDANSTVFPAFWTECLLYKTLFINSM